MPTRLVLLEAAAPSWFEKAAGPTEGMLAGRARPADTVWSREGLDLILRPDGPRIAVAEPTAGTKLPKRCAERHIQQDQTFCLGLDALTVRDAAEAEIWWAHLEQWLQLQSLADETGLWPDDHALDHGQAGVWQQAAQRLADELGLGDEYRRARAGFPSWITASSVRIAKDDGSLINARALCPCGCRKFRGRRSKPGLWGDCKRRASIARLIAIEARRRCALDDYWASEKNTPCCGTMAACPLAITLKTSGGVRSVA